MQACDQILYFLGWPWGQRLGVRTDDELSEDYPALLIRGKGVCVVSLAPELEEAAEPVAAWLAPETRGEELAAFLFEEDAPLALETAWFLIPGTEGVRPVPARGEIRFDPPAADIRAFAASMPEADWLRGGKVLVRPPSRRWSRPIHGRCLFGDLKRATKPPFRPPIGWDLLST